MKYQNFTFCDKTSLEIILNTFGHRRLPTLFVIDFEGENNIVLPLNQAKSHGIFVDVNFDNFQYKNYQNGDFEPFPPKHSFEKFPISKAEYQVGFDKIMTALQYGDSFLTNYTCQTPIKTNLSLRQIFEKAQAPFKVLWDNQFTSFSPEIFVNIIDSKIQTHPMKGTILADIPNAKNLILNNLKEKAEHATIVDLMRNDLSKIARQVKVKRFRYISEIETNQGNIYQVSSEIEGELDANYQLELGKIIGKLLPAGSICGAPKPKTLEIIEQAEGYKRGFYTGVFGIFDGKNVYSAVMIRFIEKIGDDLVFKSGGGITAQSKLDNEYQEMIDKVYLPFGN